MSTTEPYIANLVRSSLVTVREVRTHSYCAKAWELLQEKDHDNVPTGPLPYTDRAIEEFTKAHERNPDDPEIIHHLAIARHARAWDWELRVDHRAAQEWEHALGYWRTLVFSPEFWARLKTKLLQCDLRAEVAPLEEMRTNLLEYLLEIHVDFVRHHSEMGHPELATAHVELVKRARIPPATKKRLVEKVFEALTSSVPGAKSAGERASALTIVERFLAIYPDYLPALRMHAELCCGAITSCSVQKEWDKIMRLAAQAEPWVKGLAAHPELAQDRLALSALLDLAANVTSRARDRGSSLSARGDMTSLEEACGVIQFGIQWCRLALPHSTSGVAVRALLASCLNEHALALDQKASWMWNNLPNSSRHELRTIETLLVQACAELTEAVSHQSDDQVLPKNLKMVSEELSTVRRQLNLGDRQFGYGGKH